MRISNTDTMKTQLKLPEFFPANGKVDPYMPWEQIVNDKVFAPDRRKTGYKVVKGKKTFRPVTEKALQRVRFNLGTTTVQDNKEHGPFAVFDGLETARDFAKEMGGDADETITILKVRYKPSETAWLWKKLPPSVRRGVFSSNGVLVRHIRKCPAGTVFATEITPIEIVKE